LKETVAEVDTVLDDFDPSLLRAIHLTNEGALKAFMW
jgi:hypothetical protein